MGAARQVCAPRRTGGREHPIEVARDDLSRIGPTTSHWEDHDDGQAWLDRSAPAGAVARRRGRRDCAGLPANVFAQARKNTLVLGIDISDTITLDPARLAQYTSPMTVSAAYDSLVTMKPGDYINVKPSLATKWARTPDGKGWRFTLRDGVKFATGNADDGRGREVVVRPRHQSRRPALAVPRQRRPRRDRRQVDHRHHPEEAGRAAAHHPRGAGLRRARAQGRGGATAAPPTRTPRRRTRRPTWLNSNSAAPAPTGSPPGSATRRSSSCATSTTGAASRRSSASSSATSATARRSCSRCAAATSMPRST